MKVQSPLRNYYGGVTVRKLSHGQLVMTLGDYDGKKAVAISQAFYDAFVAEFINSTQDCELLTKETYK